MDFDSGDNCFLNSSGEKSELAISTASDGSRNSEALPLSSSEKKRTFIALDHTKSLTFTSSEEWKDFLPQEISELVLEKLDIVDYHRFSAVNKSWRSIAIRARQNLHFSLQQSPWLVLSPASQAAPFRRFLSLSHRKIFKLELPGLEGALCRGSSHGWLFVATRCGANFLLNPFTRLQIQLPSQTTLPPTHNRNNPLYIRKAILLPASVAATDNDHPVANFDVNNCIVVAIYGMQSLAYCRPLDQAWVYQHDKGDMPWQLIENFVVDVIYHKGKLYGACFDYGLVEIELGPPISFKRLHVPFREGLYRGENRSHWVYLVESCGDLLMVLREYRGLRDLTSEFYVFKLDLPNHCWVKLESLGDRMLFLGLHGNMSLSASLFPGFQGNSIYFTNDFFPLFGGLDEIPFRDIGVFSLATGSDKYIFISNSWPAFFAVWFVPRLP